MKIGFFGTPEFAADILRGILQRDDIMVDVVVSQPDKKVGRKKEILETPVKKVALAHKIKVLQPEKIKSNEDFFSEINKKKLDFIVVVAYGKIMPQKLLDMAKYGSVNIHGSILPDYRGASPVQSAIKDGCKETGITLMFMNDKMDEGDILDIKKVQIDPNDTTPDIFSKFALVAPQFVYETLEKVSKGEVRAQQQEHEKATYCSMIEKQDGEVFFKRQTAESIYNMYRAYTPWPGVFSYYGAKKFNLESISLSNYTGNIPGSCIQVEKDVFGIVCADRKVIVLERVKLEGKKSLDIQSFINGNKEFLEYIFG